jgi:lipoate-protein ligase A
MLLLEQTLASPAANLAFDEVLLEEVAHTDRHPRGVLRFWQSPRPFVVLGRGSRYAQEVNRGDCQRMGIAILRRISGGTAIVTGPGCLMYAVVDRRPPDTALDVDKLHQYVLGRMAAALRRLHPGVEHVGTSDLALRQPDGSLQKFSGNSVRLAGGAFLYHGTLLYDFDLELLPLCLETPPREPEYRAGRPHVAFVTNFPGTVPAMVSAIAGEWGASENEYSLPIDRIETLCRERYAQADWNMQP